MFRKVKRELAFCLALLMLIQAPLTAAAMPASGTDKAAADAGAELPGIVLSAEADILPETEQEETVKTAASRAADTAAGEDGFVFVSGHVASGIEFPETESGSGLYRSSAAEQESYNSVDEGIVPEVRDQNPHGTCWAFSAMDTALINMRKKGLAEEDDLYSPLSHAYFFYHKTGDPLGLTGEDGNTALYNGGDWLNVGGNITFSVLKMAGQVGPSSEELTPYETGNVRMTIPEEYAYEDEALLENAYFLPSTNRTLIKEYLVEYGALSVSYQATDSRGSVVFGRQDGTYGSCFYQKDSSADSANHEVILVGWDDSIPKEAFATASDARPAEDGAWLIRNSWGTEKQSAGTEDGETYEGYFWISYDEASLADFAALDMVAADTYDRCYQYDGSSVAGVSIPSGNGQSAGNIWQAQQDERLLAVSNVFYSADARYSVQIYTSEEEMEDPEDGTPLFEEALTGTTGAAGLYTLHLPEAVVIPEGNWFSVVYTNEGYQPVNFAFEVSLNQGTMKFFNDVKEGQSFFNAGSGWVDEAGEKATARIKALTEDVTVEELSFDKTSCVVTQGSGRILTLTVEPEEAAESITVSSSDPEIVSAVLSGKTVRLKGLKKGKAVITAESSLTHQTAKCEVTVVSGGGGGSSTGGGSTGSSVKVSGTSTYSGYWREVSAGKWRVFDRAGRLISSCWLCDDAVSANGKNVWYLLDQQGDQVTAGLIQDAAGNFYSLETEHNGYFGMLRYKDGTYNCSGQMVRLEFEQSHNGAFASIKNADGIEKLKQIYGVTQVGQVQNLYTASF